MARPGSKNWIKEYFPEYMDGKKPIKLRIGYGMIRGSKTTKETSPWKYGVDSYKVRGYEVTRTLSNKPPYYNSVKRKLSEQEYQEYLDSLNYFRNGKKGLNPKLLIGGSRSWREDVFTCQEGLYEPKEPRFQFFNSRPDWTR
jgi:hypothetical protein